MARASLALIAILVTAYGSPAQGKDGPEILAAGAWSKPVADSRGYALRGRLVVGLKPRSDGRRETPVYVELQDASDFIGGPMLLYCEMGRHDFRPEYKRGLQCELLDKDDKPVKSTPFPFGGAVPQSQWVSLPIDGTIRLRATPFGIHREKGIALAPHLASLWVIGEDDAGEYSLSGTFGIDPADDITPPSKDHVWRGRIELPPVKVTSRQK